ncbi:MAG: DNA mismatch repair endonuclease MutL [Deltaproteobacteria bacterium]|jgi:DNA mismatch repair protein MutL
MSVIRILSEKVASQIAAGEVIERPASVVRELADNSIDAGAKKIMIHIEKGGKRLIRLTDNGVGMGRDDLLLCIERHATSKISSVPDLFSIKTLGFRGEALPSMASVSRMEITSRPVDQLIAYRIKVAGGKLKSLEETGAPAGTTVAVEDLFFNVPARKKFLRAISTETDHVMDALSRLALPHTDIHFRLDDGEKTVLNMPSSETFLNRLAALFGHEVAGSMAEGDREFGHGRIRVYLAPPDVSRSRGDRVFVYVNKRSIRDRLLTRAVIEGYGQRLMRGRYPQAVIFIEIDPFLLDVNVHPAKQEVRFHESRFMYQSLSSAVESLLYKQFSSPFERGVVERADREASLAAESMTAEPARAYGPVQRQEEGFTLPGSQEAFPLRDRPHILGQLNNTYILCQDREGLLLVDQHAAHERVVYERLKKSYDAAATECQSFLIPPRLEFSAKEGRLLQKKLDRLAALGLEMEHFGGTTFVLRSFPSILVDVRWDAFLSELLQVLEQEGGLGRDQWLDRIWTLMACHGAIRAGQRLSQSEMETLLDQLEAADLPTNCPHGRPVSRKFTYQDLEKMFKRTL